MLLICVSSVCIEVESVFNESWMRTRLIYNNIIEEWYINESFCILNWLSFSRRLLLDGMRFALLCVWLLRDYANYLFLFDSLESATLGVHSLKERFCDASGAAVVFKCQAINPHCLVKNSSPNKQSCIHIIPNVKKIVKTNIFPIFPLNS